MHIISNALPAANFTLPAVAIRAERRSLAKRLWRGEAVDGTEFGFQLNAPLKNGDTVFVSEAARYVIEQLPEAVLEIALSAVPETAAVTGWAVGNMHWPINAQDGRILTPDDPGLRQALTRMGIAYTPTMAVFAPHRFAEFSHSH